MKITYRTGDLFAGPQRCIIHGCNAQGRMGSGVAKIVRDRYPSAYAAYRDRYSTTGLRLGEVIWADAGDRIIGNAITQLHYGHDGRRYVDYDAIGAAFQEVDRYAMAQGFAEVAMPLIGAALGGGDWTVISAIIETESRNFNPVVYTLDGTWPRHASVVKSPH